MLLFFHVLLLLRLLLQLEVIAKDTVVATEKKAVVTKEEEVCNKQAAEATALKDSCEADLAEAQPILDAANKALASLDKNAIVEVRRMEHEEGEGWARDALLAATPNRHRRQRYPFQKYLCEWYNPSLPPLSIPNPNLPGESAQEASQRRQDGEDSSRIPIPPRLFHFLPFSYPNPCGANPRSWKQCVS